jgi:hypothetical protein
LQTAQITGTLRPTGTGSTSSVAGAGHGTTSVPAGSVPSSSNSATSDPTNPTKSSISTGAIIAIAVAVGLLALVVLILGWRCISTRRRAQAQQSHMPAWSAGAHVAEPYNAYGGPNMGYGAPSPQPQKAQAIVRPAPPSPMQSVHSAVPGAQEIDGAFMRPNASELPVNASHLTPPNQNASPYAAPPYSIAPPHNAPTTYEVA